jgi:shikimate kinase
MPGCGKSTVGRLVARQLGLHFVDTDHAIELRVGMPVRDFFEVHGEAAFRELEASVLAEMAQQPGTVLATGGGAVLRPANRAVLRAHRRVVYLRSSPEELFRRLRHDTQRPLLQVADPLKRLRDLFRERDPVYRETAHYTIEAARPSVATLVAMVRMQLELGEGADPPVEPSTLATSPDARGVPPAG